jgi:cytochrome-b5 reductase
MLIYANVATNDILLRDDLEKLAATYTEKFRSHLVVEKETLGAWKGGIGFISADMIKEYCPAPRGDIKILICGPPPMVAAMKKHTEVPLPPQEDLLMVGSRLRKSPSRK